MKIADIRATPVSVPLVAPLRHANGCHWGRFVRTIVEVETDDGRVGLGELGGGGEAATAAVLGLKPYLVGRDPARRAESGVRLAHRAAPQPAPPAARRARVALPRPARSGVGRSGEPDTGRPAARPRAVRVVSLLPLSQRRRIGSSAHRGPPP